MTTTVSFEIEVSGEVSPDEIKEYIQMTLGCGSCSQHNPLISEDCDAEISCYNIQVG
jgi:hypothetical protein